jgi:copper homeostasis protein
LTQKTGSVKVEICVDAAAQGAVSAAYTGGADTVEVCAAMHTQGLTPSPEQIEAARAAFRERRGVVVMVRPRPGDFFYDAAEVATMQEQIVAAAAAGADAIACGVLGRADRALDIDAMQRLVDRAGECGLALTLHRAFDAVAEPLAALEGALRLGCSRVLSAGRPWGEVASAVDATAALTALAKRAGADLEVVAAGGVSSSNAGGILDATGGQVGLHAYSGAQLEGLTSESAVRSLVQVAHQWPVSP